MRPRIAILEAIHPDGIARMQEVADVDVRLALSASELTAAIPSYDAIVVKSVTRVDADLLRAGVRLRAVGRAGVGLDNIDLEAARRRGVPVLTTPDANTVAVADFTVALLLALARRLPEALANVAAGDFRRHLVQGRELRAMTVGILGLGRAGSAVARRLQGFGCRLVGYDPAPAMTKEFLKVGGTLVGGLEELLQQSDVLTLHVPLTAATQGMVGTAAFRHAKPGLLLINTARDRVVDTTALLDALDRGVVAAAAVDVLYPEPPFDLAPGTFEYQHPLLNHPRVLVTPHMGASTVEAQRSAAMELADRLCEVLGVVVPAAEQRGRG